MKGIPVIRTCDKRGGTPSLQTTATEVKKYIHDTSHKSVFADVPGNRLQSLKIVLLKSGPYYSQSLDHLFSDNYFAGLWTGKYWLKTD